MKRIPYGKIFLLFALNTIACAQDPGQVCMINNTSVAGVCTYLENCPRAVEDAKFGISPSLCGFYGHDGVIVCCESNGRQVDRTTSNSNSNSYSNSRSDDSVDFFYPDEVPATSNRINKSNQKCEEYSNSTVDVVQAIPLIPQTQPISISVVKCNFNGVPLIVGGTPALAGEFPFMAAIGFSLNEEVLWKCGGTLISERFVLTAAHCTTSRDAGAPVVVRLGELDLSKSDDGSEPEDYDIDRIIVHPDYRYPQKYNDIALLKLKYTVRFTKFIRPACLYTQDSVPQRKAVATGWGKTDYLAANTNNKLLKVALDVFDNDQCSRTYKQSKYLPEGIKSTMLCAGELKGGRDTCQGDSGGPLLMTKEDNNCVFHIIGVTSFGKYCGASNILAVYTRVSEYVSWIENIVW